MAGGVPPEEGQISRDKVKWRPLANRACTSSALLRTSHELVLSKYVRLIFKGAPWRIRHALVAPPYGQVTN